MGSIPTLVFMDSHKTSWNDEIPEDFLLLSNDKTILQGFQPNITAKDISIGGYKTLVIPESVKKISNYAFFEMFNGVTTDISRIVFNSSLQEIGDGAFEHCSGISSIEFASTDSHLVKIGYRAFASNEHIQEALNLPSTLVEIGEQAFYNCQRIYSLTLHNSLVSVGNQAFASCIGISHIDLSEYENIPDWLFKKNFIFQSVGEDQTQQNTVSVQTRNIDLNEWQDVLYKRQSLPNPDDSEVSGFEISDDKIIPTKYFDIDKTKHELKGFVEDFDTSKLVDYNVFKIPVDIISIKKEAFKDKIIGCHLKLIAGDSLTTIEESAFENCTGIYGTIDLVDVSTIGDKAFKGCQNISGKLEIQNLSTLGNETFSNCKGIESVVFPSSADTMGYAAFSGCTNLSLIDVSGFGSDQIPSSWYWNQPGVDEKVLPFEDLNYTGIILLDTSCSVVDQWKDRFIKWGLDEVDSYDPHLTEKNAYWQFVTGELNEVPDNMFASRNNHTVCAGLNNEGRTHKQEYQKISVPVGYEEIDKHAFDETFNLHGKFANESSYWFLEIPNGMKIIDAYAFYNDSCLLSTFKLPNTITNIGDSAFLCCSQLRGAFHLPTHLLKIGDNAFKSCWLLSSDNLIIPNTIQEIGISPFFGTRVSKVSLQANSNSIKMSHQIFGSMFLLKEIDFSNINLSTAKTWQCESDTFALDAIESGKVIISQSDNENEWRTFLSNLGLPDEWDIEKKGSYEN